MPEKTTPLVNNQNKDENKEATAIEQIDENAENEEENKVIEQIEIRQDVDLYDEPKLTEIIVDYYDGERQEGLFHGFGTAYFIGGNVYEGQFYEGEMQGTGRYTWSDGVIYEGDFRHNEITGSGKYSWPDGSTYEGEVFQGLRSGKGSYSSPSCPSSYTGQWTNGKRQGWGIMYYDNDGLSYYDGQWYDNMRHGFGVRRYCSGNIYEGEWKNGFRNGRGTMRWLDKSETYAGTWKNGVQHGHGVHTWFVPRAMDTQFPLRNQYIGNWQDGKRNGTGTFFYANGTKYEGEWLQNRKHGKGKYFFKNGTIFEGSFEEDHMMQYFGQNTDSNRPVSPMGTPTRLKSPLGSYTDDASEGRFDGSLALNVDHLSSSKDVFDIQDEVSSIRNVMLRYISNLRQFYRFYSRLGHSASVDNTFIMTKLQFWCFLRDCNFHYHGITLTDMDRIIAKHAINSENIHYPYQQLLVRDYFNAITALANAIYGKEFSSEEDKLSKCLRKLITENIVNNAQHVKGPFLYDSRRSTTAMQLMHRTFELFLSICSKHEKNADELTLRMREFLFMLTDLELIDDHLTAKHVIEILGADNPNALQEGECNLEIEITFLEFFEALISCAPISIKLASDKESVLTRPSTAMTNRPLSVEGSPNADVNTQVQFEGHTSENETKINESVVSTNQVGQNVSQAIVGSQNESKQPQHQNKDSNQITDGTRKRSDTIPPSVPSNDSRNDYVDGKILNKISSAVKREDRRKSSGVTRSESGHDNNSVRNVDERSTSQARPFREQSLSGMSQISESLFEEEKMQMEPIATNAVAAVGDDRLSEGDNSVDAYLIWAKKVHIFFNEKVFPAAEKFQLVKKMMDKDKSDTLVNSHE